jgi:hypothetical protein
MATAQLKEKLHEYTDTADEKKLEAIYTILQDTIVRKIINTAPVNWLFFTTAGRNIKMEKAKT